VGIALSLLFLVWFVSGIGMIFARGMPGLTPGERMDRRPTLDLTAIRLRASEAAEKAEIDRVARAALLTVMGRPADRFTNRGTVPVFADTGELLESVNPAEAMNIARQFMNISEKQLQYAGEITEPDQWSIGERRELPMHKIRVADVARTEMYISEADGEVEIL